MDMTATSLYGTPRSVQPTRTLVPEVPAAPGTNTRTEPRASGALANPVLWLVGIVGVAILLIATVRLEVEVSA